MNITLFRRTIVVLATLGIALWGVSSCDLAKQSEQSELSVEQMLELCHSKVLISLSQLVKEDGSRDYSKMPRNIAPTDSVWHCRPIVPEEWCDGFWPGVLWYDFENTGDSAIAKEADRFTRTLKAIVDVPIFDHDLGFLMITSYGNGYRLTGNDEYKQVLLNAADSLATLYNPKVGTICSWPRNEEMFGGHNTIMDNMINLELLFWAAKNGGGQYLYDIALKHAETTMLNHFRSDGTCYHVAVYNKETGDFIRGCTHQGYSDSSTWARGQAWAIYGYTMVFRETKDPKFLEFAQKVADVYLSRLPKDRVPYWDFDDPEIPNAPRDASAACIVASALLELENYVDKATKERYDSEAKAMLSSLSSDAYWAKGKPAFLLHSTGHRPAGSEIGYSIIYADYYYIEALTRLKSQKRHN